MHYKGLSGTNETIALKYLSLTLNISPAYFQRKLPKHRHASLVFVSIVEMHGHGPLFQSGPDTGRRRIGGLKWS